MSFGKIGKTLLSLLLGAAGVVGTLLFEPHVFCGVTLPLAARAVGWKAKAVVARISPLGTLAITGLEAVGVDKSRVELDSAQIDFTPLSIFSGKPEIIQAKLTIGFLDLEYLPEKGKGGALVLPIILREAKVELTEGRLRCADGAWILRSAKAQAEGWDGYSPKKIQGKLGQLEWSGPGKEELLGTVEFSALKSSGSGGEHIWEVNATTDVSTVVDLSPAELVVPCRLAVSGTATENSGGDWKVERTSATWQGAGEVQLSVTGEGKWLASGEWSATVQVQPVDLRILGVLLQSRGVKATSGSATAMLVAEGGKEKGIRARVTAQGEGVQIFSLAGPTWPARPSSLTLATAGSWSEKEGMVRLSEFMGTMGQKGSVQDFEVRLDRPANFQLRGVPTTSGEAATLQWALRGVEMAAVAPFLVSPQKVKIQGGQFTASGQAQIQGSKINLAGKVESKAMSASGSLLGGSLQMNSATADFKANLEGAKTFCLEEAKVSVDWAGSQGNDGLVKVQAEWDVEKSEGWVAGDAEMGLVGLGQAWSAAKLWPQAGQAKVHLEFAGNLTEKGSGLLALTCADMRWPGEKVAAWQGKGSARLQNAKGIWSLRDVALGADRGGEELLNGKGGVDWNVAKDEGRAKMELQKADSSLLVPILTIVTPTWRWKKAMVSGSFSFERKEKQDRVDGNLQGDISVETGAVATSHLVELVGIQAGLEASWPSESVGMVSVDRVQMQAQHLDGTDAIRVSLDQPLRLEKAGAGEWKPSGKAVATGSIQFTSWPMGIFGPLVFPNVEENSIRGTLSGFLKVRSDPEKGLLSGDLDLQAPDFALETPRCTVPPNQVSLQAALALQANREIQFKKAHLTAQQAGKTWLELTAQPEAHPALSVKGKMDLAIAAQNVAILAGRVSSGSMELQAEVANPKNGARTIGYSVVLAGLSGTIPGGSPVGSAEVKSQGILEWQGAVKAAREVVLTATGEMGDLKVTNFSWDPAGKYSWDGLRISDGWVRVLAGSWLKPVRWVDGDVVAGEGFWEESKQGGSGTVDFSLLEARLLEDRKAAAVSLRISGQLDYESRTKSFALQDASLLFADFRDHPVILPNASWSSGLLKAQMRGGFLDLRGILTQCGALPKSASAAQAGAPKEPLRLDLSAELDQVIVEEAAVGPVRIPRLRYGPEGISLEPSSVVVEGGSIQASLLSSGQGQPVRAEVRMIQFPLGAILGSLIQDAKGPIGGLIDLQLSAQASDSTLAALQQSLSGQGNFRLYQAHLEKLPSLGKALQSAGQFLGSSLVAHSEINNVGANFTLAGSRISTSDLKAVGTALSAQMNGWIDWVNQTLDFKVKISMTREAIASSGQLQGVMTQLVGSSNDYYTKIPGEAVISGSLANPQVKMDIAKMLLEGGINTLINGSVGALQGAGGAAGGAAGAAAQPVNAVLQGVGNLFKGF